MLCDDCPRLEGAVGAAAWGVFFNQGEVCTAASRLLVQEDIADSFVEKVVEVARAIRTGDPLDPATRFGAMVSEEQLNTALRYIDQARGEGNRLLLGGERTLAEQGGYYLEPTIFGGLATTSTPAREDVFGPVQGGGKSVGGGTGWSGGRS